MQYVNTKRNTDLRSLVSVYECSVLDQLPIIEALDLPMDDGADTYFNDVVEINITISTNTQIGDVEYKCVVDKSRSNGKVLTAIARGDDIEEEMSVVVTSLPASASSLNVTIYVGNSVVERFVTNISFFDREELELNIVKQELV